MYCAGRSGSGCSSVAQRKPVTKSKENSAKTNSQSFGRTAVKNSPSIEITRHKRNSWSSSETRLPLKDIKNTNTLSVATARKSTSLTTKVKCNSTYSVTNSLNSIGPSSYIKEAFRNKGSKKIIKKKVVSPAPNPKQTAFSKVIIFDGVPTDSVWTPSEQDTPFCNLLRNIEVVTVDGKEELLPFNFLQDARERIGPRTTLVDWLVKVQNYVDAGNSVLFMVIKIFDKLLARQKIQNNKCQLYATAAFWICYKHYNSEDPISAPDLLKLTINKYSVNELLMTAKDILQFLNYKLHTDLHIYTDVYIFVCITLKINKDIYNCAHFFLEILLLDPNCNCFAVSLQASAAVYLALTLFNYNESYFENLDTAYWSHKPSEMTEIHKKIIEFVLLMSDLEYPYRNSFLKYSTDRYGQISKKVAEIIIAL